MSSTSSVKVAVRVRPMAAKELLANSSDCISYIPDTTQIVVGGGISSSKASVDVPNPGSLLGSGAQPPMFSSSTYHLPQKSFTFDYVFDPATEQQKVYTSAVKPLVDRFLEGFNATILAYGQTGSGKTYSMGIGLDGLNQTCSDQHGIVPRGITEIFDRLKALQSEKGSDAFKYSLAVSFLELYNEEVVDLLNPRPRTALGGPSIREDSHGKIVWVNVKEEEVHSPEELLNVLQRGTLCRTTASTDMNATSSRSHAIFSLTLRQEKKSRKDTGAVDISTPLSSVTQESLISKFHFVDLAGSERLKRTNAEGDRKKEGISINQGLLALGNVISALGDESRRANHIPYRDSKLTRMLQDSLGGNSQTLMLACVSPSDLNYNESVNTLHYANRARNIKNRVVINQQWVAGMGSSLAFEKEIKSLRATVSQLRTELAMLKSSEGSNGGAIGKNFNLALLRDPLSNVTAADTSDPDNREIQFYQRRERDLLAELDMQKKKEVTLQYQVDKLTFTSNRLKSRVKELVSELSEKTSERDAALVQKAVALKGVITSSPDNENVPIQPPKLSDEPIVVDLEKDDENDEDKKQGGDIGSGQFIDLAHIHPLIQDYITEISTLRYRLTEAQDKLAWQVEAMTQVGRKNKAGSKVAWASPRSKHLSLNMDSDGEDALIAKSEGLEFEALGIPAKPHLKRLHALQKELEISSRSDEAAFLKTLKENPNLTNVLEGQLPTKLNANPDGILDSPSKLVESLTADTLAQEFGHKELVFSDETNVTEPDMFLLINKLQNDIAQHEALVERIQKRDSEYEVMKKAYEQKLGVLQKQVSQVQQERDMAIRKMQEASGLNSIGKKARIHAANTKYDEEKQRLDNQIAEYRRKLGENSRLQTSNRTRMDMLTRELQATIEVLKAEKSRMLKELRKEAQKTREMENANQREISRLRKRERAAAEAAKRLERTNEQTKKMLKKRNEEVARNRNKLQTVMALLRRSNATNRVFKSVGTGSSPGSKRPTRPATAISTVTSATSASARNSPPSHNSRIGHFRRKTGSSVASPRFQKILADSSQNVSEFFKAVRSPMKFSNKDALHSSAAGETHSFAIKVALRKSTIDSEMDSYLTVSRIQKSIDERKVNRFRLVGEQKELLTEREKVVQSEFERTGLFDPDAPQYMDERIAVIDSEISTIDNEMEGLEESLKRFSSKTSHIEASNPFEEAMKQLAEDDDDLDGKKTPQDVIWSNVSDIVHALNQDEMEYVLEQYLKQLIETRIFLAEAEELVQERDNMLSDWKKMAEQLRKNQAIVPTSKSQVSPTRDSRPRTRSMSDALQTSSPSGDQGLPPVSPRRQVLESLPGRPSPPIATIKDIGEKESVTDDGISRSVSLPLMSSLSNSPRGPLPKIQSSASSPGRSSLSESSLADDDSPVPGSRPQRLSRNPLSKLFGRSDSRPPTRGRSLSPVRENTQQQVDESTSPKADSLNPVMTKRGDNTNNDGIESRPRPFTKVSQLGSLAEPLAPLRARSSSTQESSIMQLEHDEEFQATTTDTNTISTRTRSRRVVTAISMEKPSLSSLTESIPPSIGAGRAKGASTSPTRGKISSLSDSMSMGSKDYIPIQQHPLLLPQQDLGTRMNILRKRYGYDNTTTVSAPTPIPTSTKEISDALGSNPPKDVFERLAQSHTLASQAKVIQRMPHMEQRDSLDSGSRQGSPGQALGLSHMEPLQTQPAPHISSAGDT